MISLPEVQFSSDKIPEIFVGKQLNNEVLFYLKSDESIKSCFVDSDMRCDASPGRSAMGHARAQTVLSLRERAAGTFGSCGTARVPGQRQTIRAGSE